MLSQILQSYNLRRFNRNIQLFLLFGIPFFAGLGVFSLLYNLYLLRLGFQEDFIGRLSGMMPLASGLLAFPVGLWSDRVGRKPFLVAGALLLGFSQVGLCFVRHPLLLLGISFVGGLSPAFIFVNHVPFLAENCRAENRGHAISMAFGIQLLTRMVVSLIGGSLPVLFAWMAHLQDDQPEPFRYALLLGAACSMVAVLPILKMRPGGTGDDLSESEKRDPHLSQKANGSTTPVAGIPLGILAIFTAISSFRGLAFGLSMPFFNVFFDDVLGASAATIGAIFFASQFVGFPSSMAAPALSQRLGPVRCIVPLRVIGAVCLVFFGGVPALVWGVVAFLLISAVDSMTTPMEMTFVTNVVTQPYWGRAQSLRVTGFQILAGGGSIWAGEMILRYGYGPAFALSGGATLLSGLVLLLAFGWTRRQS